MVAKSTGLNSSSSRRRLDLSRVAQAIDVVKTQQSHVTLVGAGASVDFAVSLARCGVRSFTLFDPDHVELANVARQGHYPTFVNRPKVEAAKARLETLDPAIHVVGMARDFTQLRNRA